MERRFDVIRFGCGGHFLLGEPLEKDQPDLALFSASLSLVSIGRLPPPPALVRISEFCQGQNLEQGSAPAKTNEFLSENIRTAVQFAFAAPRGGPNKSVSRLALRTPAMP